MPAARATPQRRAFPAWATLGPNARRLLLLKVADALASRTEDFIVTMMAEIGATRAWAGFNVRLGIGMLREAAALTTQIRGETMPSDRRGCFAMSVRKPVGVVLGIAPWNGPLVLGVRAIAAPLACGNTVILKGSEISPGTHAMIGEVRCGLPRRRGQRHPERAIRRGRCRGRDDQPPRRAAGQLRRVHPDGSHHRQVVRRTAQAGRA
jgi:acyl-CoA reductase-like NAD-dependent aldehyde dehydrogenase